MSKLRTIAAGFAGQIAVAVWLGKLSEEAAREALESYALACHQAKRAPRANMTEALMCEYRRRREGQDMCS